MPTAPKEYGGMGGDWWQRYIIRYELARLFPQVNSLTLFQGVDIVGPTLLLIGSEEQKKKYVPPLAHGEMEISIGYTEPQAGTDLGLIRTRATPAKNGSHAINGAKIFISGGEHDLAENIVHLVLARIDGAPEGTRGLSLFVVPKIIPNADGSLGPRNAVSCASIEEKMGIHGNATCVMNYDGNGRVLASREHRRADRPGDADLDGAVNFADLARLAEDWLR